MNFIGIDLAWGNRNPTGLALLVSEGDGYRLVSSARRTTDTEILEWVETCGGKDVWLGIDAPIIARNPPGTSRPADKMVSSRFGRYHAGAYPANRVRCERPVRLCRKLRRRGFSSNPFLPGRAGCRQLEIFPHLVQVAFFERPRIIKYKKGPVAVRQAGLADFQTAIGTHLTRQDPPLLPSPELSRCLMKTLENSAAWPSSRWRTGWTRCFAPTWQYTSGLGARRAARSSATTPRGTSSPSGTSVRDCGPIPPLEHGDVTLESGHVPL